MNLANLCTSPHFLRVLYILNLCMDIICIVVPIVIIVTLMMKAFNLVTSGDASKIKDLLKLSVNKIIAGLALFLLPTAIDFALSLINEDNIDLYACKTNTNLESIKYYEKLEPTELKIQKLEQNPTKQNLAAAQQAVSSITSFAKEDTILDYLQRITAAETKVDAYEKQTECRGKGGTYKDGFCKIPPKYEKPQENTGNNGSNGNSNGNSSNGNSDGSSSGTAPSGGATGGLVDSNLLNGNYYVIQPAVGVKEYLNVIGQHRISQTHDTSIYGGYCLAFAYIHAYSLFSGNTSARAADAKGYKYASNFDGYVNDNKQEVLKNVYNELTNGRPVIIQVNGNKKGTSRHYVTVVGFKKSVKSGETITEDDLLIIDSWDGKLESMDGSSSRFMVTGKACRKKYSGYQMYYVER